MEPFVKVAKKCFTLCEGKPNDLTVLLWMLYNTTREPYQLEDGRTVDTNCVAIAVRNLSSVTGLTERNVRTAIKHLIQTEVIKKVYDTKSATRSDTESDTTQTSRKCSIYLIKKPFAPYEVTQRVTQRATQKVPTNKKYSSKKNTKKVDGGDIEITPPPEEEIATETYAIDEDGCIDWSKERKKDELQDEFTGCDELPEGK